MFRLKIIKKFIAIVANLSLLLNSFIPFLLITKPVYSQEYIPTIIPTPTEIQDLTPTQTAGGSDISVTPVPELTIEPSIVSPTEEQPTIIPTPEIITNIPTETIIPTPTEIQDLTPTQTAGGSDISITPTVTPTPTEIQDLTPTQTAGGSDISTNWTFEKVELNKEYIAPQNSGVKLIFTKLPEISGNIKIQEITLTPEQIQQTGSLSDKAYDITSDMTDGTFAYNLSLPIPESSKGKDVDIKFAEEISQINLAQTANNITENNSIVTTTNLNHFTIFFAVVKTTDKNLVEKEIFNKGENVYINTLISDGTFTKIRIKDPKNNLKKEYDKTISPIAQYIYTIGLSDPIGKYTIDIGSYQKIGSHKECVLFVCTNVPEFGWVWQNSIDSFTIKSVCGDNLIDTDEQCDDGNILNGDGCSNQCIIEDNWKCFGTTSFCLNAPTLNFPLDGATVNGNPKQSWTTVDGANHYVYESYYDNQAKNKIYTKNTGKNNYRSVGGNQTITIYWRVKAVDSIGNESNWSQLRKLNIDNTSPIITLGSYITTPTNQDITVTASTDEGILNVGSTTFTSNGSFEFIATDSAKNVSTKTVTINNIDKTAPVLLNKTNFGDIWYNTDQTSTFNFTDENGIVSGNNPTCTINTEGAQQTCSVDLNVCDSAGNCNTETIISNGANIDKTIPTVSSSINPISPDGQNGWYWTQPQITLVGLDINLQKIEYQWDSQFEGFWITYSNPIVPSTEGNHDLYYRAIDKTGNISTIGSKNIRWDKTDLEYGPQNLSANPNPTSGSISKIKWEIGKDNIGIDKYEIQWKLDDSHSYSKTVGAGTTEVEIDQLIEGHWTVKVVAFDQSGRAKDASIDLNIDRTSPTTPTLVLDNTGTGTATLSWNAISDAKDYVIWYGSIKGIHQFGARVGNVTSYTIKGLGTGNYYFIVKAIDEAQNQSSDSNEVNTGNITGAVGINPDQPATGFSQQVLGDTTQITPTTTPPIELGDILGSSITKKISNWWWLLLLGIIPLYVVGKKISKRKK